MNPGTRARRLPLDRLDLAILASLALGWLAVTYWATGGQACVMYDTFRDMAWAHNIQAGRTWADPMLAGAPWWYAPGNPLLFAAGGQALSLPTETIYATSVYWANIWLPLLLYALVRITWDRATALLSAPFCLLGSFWWLTHMVANMPSIQGVAVNLAALLCWHITLTSQAAPRRGWLATVATGLFIAASAWVHPLCAMTLAGALALHAALLVLPPLERDRRSSIGWVGMRLTAAGLISLLLSLPLIAHLAALPHQNPDPLRYVAGEIYNPHYYAHAHAPLLLPLALLGVWRTVTARPQAGWAVAYLVIGLAGQVSGYLNHAAGIPTPLILPHEFQWHAQLATGILAAVGATWLATRAAARIPWPRTTRARRAACLGALTACTLGPALRWAPHVGVYLQDLASVQRHHAGTLDWIRRHTDMNDVFACEPDVGYRLVAGLTGRKVVAVPAGHMNPAVDARRRLADLERLLSTRDPDEFASLARQYGVTFVLRPPIEAEGSGPVRDRGGWPGVRLRFRDPATGVEIKQVLLRNLPE